ncbi:MAG: hypothetical protein H7843_14265 [Nitrospirota bacterium]
MNKTIISLIATAVLLSPIVCLDVHTQADSACTEGNCANGKGTPVFFPTAIST